MNKTSILYLIDGLDEMYGARIGLSDLHVFILCPHINKNNWSQLPLSY